jgi:WD40 repeat protein
MATASDDGTARIWDTQSGAPLTTLNDGNAVTNVQFSPDGGLALSTDQQGMVRVWDIGVGEPVTRLAPLGTGQTYPLGFAKQGSVVYGLNGVVQVRGLGTSTAASLGSGSVVLWKSATGALLRQIPLPQDVGAARATAGVPCAKQGLSLEDCVLPPPDTVAVPVSSQGVEWGLLGVAVNPTASEVAYAEATGVGILNANGRLVAQLSLPQRPTGLAFVDAKVMAMTDQAVYLWAPASRDRALRLPQRSPTMDAELSGDGRRLVTGDLDGTVTVWSTSSARPLAVFRATRAFAAQVRQVSGGLEPGVSGGPPVPLRVAINAEGTAVAAGTSWQTVFLWSVSQHRLTPPRFVSSPADVGTGSAGAATAGGYNGPWPIGQLTFAADGSALVATTFPYHSVGDSRAAATTDLISASGSLVASYAATDIDGAIDPGVAPSPRGDALVSGVLAVSPTSSTGNSAVYETANGERLLNLQSAALPATSDYFSWPSAPQPWAPNGTDLLAGSGAIYACTACGSLTQLQGAATTRLKWLAPLSSARDNPPSGNPYR